MKMYYYLYKCVLFLAKSLMELFKVAMWSQINSSMCNDSW